MKKHMDMKKSGKKAVITVEAAFVCSLICLFLCGMISLTFRLYERVEEASGILQARELSKEGANLIRLEAFVETLLQEVEDNAGGV